MEGSNENKCPLCGKETQDGEQFCRDCQEIAQNEYLNEPETDEEDTSTKKEEAEEDIAGNNTEHGEEESTTKKKGGRKTFWFFIIGLFVCVIAGGIGAHITKKEKQSKETELAFWDNCIEENTTLSYSKYLVRYPTGLFHIEAQDKIRRLKYIEDSTWISVSKTNNADKLYAYLNDYPSSPYKSIIRRRIDSLSWIILSKENTAASYQTYLENIKLGDYDGQYKEEAQIRYDYLNSLKMVEGKELTAIKNDLKQTLKLLSDQKYAELQKNMPDTLTLFYAQKGKKVSLIIDSLKSDMKKKQVKSILYTVNTDTLTVIKDMNDICYTGFSVVKQITYTNKRKKTEAVKLSIQVELNNKNQIQAVYREKKKFP